MQQYKPSIKSRQPEIKRSIATVYILTTAIVLTAFGGENNQFKFADVTEEVGLAGLSGGKASWVDFNNDGWVDLYVGGTLWQNREGEKFVKVENLPETMRGAGIWGDFNNNGYPDLYCYQRNRLFRNENGERFIDVTDKLPEEAVTRSRGAVWGDFNQNGFLDLYIAGYEDWNENITYPDLILLNQHGEKFILASRETRYRARGVTACDFNMNGKLDIYVSNYRLQPNLLLINDGQGNFTDAAREHKVAGDNVRGAWGHTIGSAWGDLDNSGYFDLFVGNFSHPPAYQDRPQFLKNLGSKHDFAFEDMSAKAGLHWQESYASPALADFDNDGYLDLFFTTVYEGDHSVLYRNNGDWHFTDLTEISNINTRRTYQAAWADYNNNGHLDLVSGGRLFRNPGSDNRWLKIRLEGGETVNRSAIGSQVRIKIGEQVISRQVEGATGEGNQNELTLHFGLGQAAPPASIQIRWTDGVEEEIVIEEFNRLYEFRRSN